MLWRAGEAVESRGESSTMAQALTEDRRIEEEGSDERG
jgi:hypothetical protein